jgi:hypothetical protein
VRRAYLYLALFAGVIGGMILAVSLINTLLGASSGVISPGWGRVFLNPSPICSSLPEWVLITD